MFRELIEKLGRREDLTTDEAAGAMAVIMRGDAAPAQIAGLLIGLAMKGEHPSELVGFARTMRAEAVPLSRPAGEVFDTCGTGGDRSGTFNISTAAAIVLAACGVRVAKHGNRSVSSKCGSADVLEALGVQIAAPPAVVERVSRRRPAWRSSSRRRFIRRCGTPHRRAAISACARRSTSSAR